MPNATSHATDFAKNCRAYHINSYPLTPDLIGSMAQQAIILNMKLSQAMTHIDSLIAEIDSLKNPTGESK